MMRIFPDAWDMNVAAAELFVTLARQALPKGRFSVALAGGQTPRPIYEMLARSPFMDQVPWHIVYFFWGDERWVPPSDPRSNERMVRQALLDHIPVPEDQIYPMYCPDMTPTEAADAYEAMLRQFFKGERQLFDLVFLGLGENGHTASLFPHTPVLQEKERWVGSFYEPEEDLSRVTLTPTAINHSAQAAFLVAGNEKATILHQVLEGGSMPNAYPAQLIRPEANNLLWLVDSAAAQRLVAPEKFQHQALRQ